MGPKSQGLDQIQSLPRACCSSQECLQGSPQSCSPQGAPAKGHTASGQTAPSPALLGTTPGRTKDFWGRTWSRGGVGAEPESVRGTKGRSTQELSTSRLREALKMKRKAARINWVLRESATLFHPSLPQCGHQGPKAPSMSVYLFGQSSQSAQGRRGLGREWGVGKTRLLPPRCVALRSSQTLSGPVCWQEKRSNDFPPGWG